MGLGPIRRHAAAEAALSKSSVRWWQSVFVVVMLLFFGQQRAHALDIRIPFVESIKAAQKALLSFDGGGRIYPSNNNKDQLNPSSIRTLQERGDNWTPLWNRAVGLYVRASSPSSPESTTTPPEQQFVLDELKKLLVVLDQTRPPLSTTNPVTLSSNQVSLLQGALDAIEAQLKPPEQALAEDDSDSEEEDPSVVLYRAAQLIEEAMANPNLDYDQVYELVDAYAKVKSFISSLKVTPKQQPAAQRQLISSQDPQSAGLQEQPPTFQRQLTSLTPQQPQPTMLQQQQFLQKQSPAFPQQQVPPPTLSNKQPAQQVPATTWQQASDTMTTGSTPFDSAKELVKLLCSDDNTPLNEEVSSKEMNARIENVLDSLIGKVEGQSEDNSVTAGSDFKKTLEEIDIDIAALDRFVRSVQQKLDDAEGSLQPEPPLVSDTGNSMPELLSPQTQPGFDSGALARLKGKLRAEEAKKTEQLISLLNKENADEEVPASPAVPAESGPAFNLKSMIQLKEKIQAEESSKKAEEARLLEQEAQRIRDAIRREAEEKERRAMSALSLRNDGGDLGLWWDKDVSLITFDEMLKSNLRRLERKMIQYIIDNAPTFEDVAKVGQKGLVLAKDAVEKATPVVEEGLSVAWKQVSVAWGAAYKTMASAQDKYYENVGRTAEVPKGYTTTMVPKRVPTSKPFVVTYKKGNEQMNVKSETQKQPLKLELDGVSPITATPSLDNDEKESTKELRSDGQGESQTQVFFTKEQRRENAGSAFNVPLSQEERKVDAEGQNTKYKPEVKSVLTHEPSFDELALESEQRKRSSLPEQRYSASPESKEAIADKPPSVTPYENQQTGTVSASQPKDWSQLASEWANLNREKPIAAKTNGVVAEKQQTDRYRRDDTAKEATQESSSNNRSTLWEERGKSDISNESSSFQPSSGLKQNTERKEGTTNDLGEEALSRYSDSETRNDKPLGSQVSTTKEEILARQSNSWSSLAAEWSRINSDKKPTGFQAGPGDTKGANEQVLATGTGSLRENSAIGETSSVVKGPDQLLRPDISPQIVRSNASPSTKTTEANREAVKFSGNSDWLTLAQEWSKMNSERSSEGVQKSPLENTEPSGGVKDSNSGSGKAQAVEDPQRKMEMLAKEWTIRNREKSEVRKSQDPASDTISGDSLEPQNELLDAENRDLSREKRTLVSVKTDLDGLGEAKQERAMGTSPRLEKQIPDQGQAYWSQLANEWAARNRDARP